jgi:hypothetical protein
MPPLLARTVAVRFLRVQPVMAIVMAPRLTVAKVISRLTSTAAVRVGRLAARKGGPHRVRVANVP